jgi:hypothetical protein
MLASSVVDRGYKHRSGPTKDYKIVICCFFAKHAALRRKSKDWEQVNFQRDDDEVRFVLDQHAELDFIVLAHWNNSLRVDMSLHSETLFWLRADRQNYAGSGLYT